METAVALISLITPTTIITVAVMAVIINVKIEENTMDPEHDDELIIPTETQKTIIRAILPFLKTTTDLELVKIFDKLSLKFMEYQDDNNDVNIEFNSLLGELEDKIEGNVRNPGWLEHYIDVVEDSLTKS